METPESGERQKRAGQSPGLAGWVSRLKGKSRRDVQNYYSFTNWYHCHPKRREVSQLLEKTRFFAALRIIL
jgi:hypothetical protein